LIISGDRVLFAIVYSIPPRRGFMLERDFDCSVFSDHFNRYQAFYFEYPSFHTVHKPASPG